MSAFALHPSLMLTVPEVARRLGRDCPFSMVFDLLASGELRPVYPVGRHGKIRIRVSEVDAYLDRRAAATRTRLARSHASSVRISLAHQRERGAA